MIKKISNFNLWVFLNLKSLFSVFILNILIMKYKIKGKKVIFFYHPRELLTSIQTSVFKDLFKDLDQDIVIIYGHVAKKNLGDKYFFIKEGQVQFLLNVHIFMSCYISDKFTNQSKRIYIDHNIYCAQLTSLNKQKKLCERLSTYDIVFSPSQNVITLYKEMFSKYKNIKIPVFKEIGYPRFDFLNTKLRRDTKNIKDSIIISPTNYYAFPDLTLISNLKELIEELLSKTNYKVIFRPHPSNRRDSQTLKIVDYFRSSNKFQYDISEDYSDVFSRSMFLITDLSDMAYMFAFLTLRPVIFYPKDEQKISLYKYENLHYFINREKIGVIIKNISSITREINNLENKLESYESSIMKIKQEIKYLGKSRKRFYDEINSLVFKNLKAN